MISIQASVSKGWLHKHAGFKFDDEYYFNPLKRRTQDIKISEFLKTEFPRYRIHNLESNLVSLAHYNEEQIYVGGIQPNLIIGMLLGAEFIAYPDQDPDISEKPLDGLRSIKELPVPEQMLQSSIISNWTKEITTLQNSEKAPIIPPFFWDTGSRATIHGPFTTALKFFGQDIIFAIYDRPGFLTDFFRWYEDSCNALISHFAALAGFSISSLHVGECSGTMLGQDDYRSFITPSLERLGKSIAPIRLHHCGNCTYLLDELKTIPAIHSLDTGSGTDVAAVRRVFGNTFSLDFMPPVELLLEGVSTHSVRRWLEQVLKENAGGPLTLNYHLEPGYDQTNHLILHELLYEKGIAEPGRK